MFPEIASTTSARVGAGLRSSSAFAAIIMPGVQKPHCAAKLSMKAVWIGCRLRAGFQPVRGLDRTARDRLGERDAGEMRLAVDQHGADPAGALPAAEFRRGVADAIAQRGEQVRAAIDEHRDVVAVMLELDGRFHACSARSRQQALQMHRHHLAPIPGAGDRVGRRLGALGRNRDRRRDAALVERACLPARARPTSRASASAPSRHRRRARPRCVRRSSAGARRSRAPRCPSASRATPCGSETPPGCGRLNVTLATRPFARSRFARNSSSGVSRPE